MQAYFLKGVEISLTNVKILQKVVVKMVAMYIQILNDIVETSKFHLYLLVVFEMWNLKICFVVIEQNL
jgi:hypothetical protein